MSYPKQDSVMARLQRQSLRELQRKADREAQGLRSLWASAARLLKADIAAAYQASAPRDGKWDLTALQSSGTYHKLSFRFASVLNDFRQRAKSRVRRAVSELRDESARRQAWALDQVTPGSRRIKYSKHSKLHEAEAPLPSGFDERWDQWVQGYHEALLRNLRMNALSGGSLRDAVDEVDATRVSTPAYTLDAAMDRLWDYYSWEAVAAGMHQVVEDNPEEADEEVWRTSGDLRVCDDCDANEGDTAEEADGTIPLHPNCNCFYQLVPASYAELLRSGDEADRELARQMDEQGVAPNAMVIRAENGDVIGKTVVDFERWDSGAPAAVSGGI